MTLGADTGDRRSRKSTRKTLAALLAGALAVAGLAVVSQSAHAEVDATTNVEATTNVTTRPAPESPLPQCVYLGAVETKGACTPQPAALSVSASGTFSADGTSAQIVISPKIPVCDQWWQRSSWIPSPCWDGASFSVGSPVSLTDDGDLTNAGDIYTESNMGFSLSEKSTYVNNSTGDSTEVDFCAATRSNFDLYNWGGHAINARWASIGSAALTCEFTFSGDRPDDLKAATWIPITATLGVQSDQPYTTSNRAITWVRLSGDMQNPGPEADFEVVEQLGGTANLENKSSHPWDLPLTYEWELPNSRTSTEKDPVVDLEPGFNDFRLETTDPDGKSDTATKQIFYTPIPPTGPPVTGKFETVRPCRVVDTRKGGGPFANREIREYQVRGTGPAFEAQGGNEDGCGIPEDAISVEASVTAVSPSTGGFFRTWPADESMPNATFMNMAPGKDITNTGTVAMAKDGPPDIKARNFGGPTDYVIDVQGYFVDTGDQVEPSSALQTNADEAEGGVYVPITPCRTVDTRRGGGLLANREIREYQIRGDGQAFSTQGGLDDGCGIPESAVAAEVSVTAVTPTTGGFFRTWPADESMPNATFMNMAPGQNITNTGTVTMAQTGPPDIKIRNFGGPTDYVIDVQGYFIDVADLSASAQANGAAVIGAEYASITPCRTVDTRIGGGPFANREIRDYQIAGPGSRFASQGGRPGGCGIPKGIVGVEASITAVSPNDSGFFRAWPSDESMPNATFMNFARGEDITNTGSVTLAISGDDDLRVRNFGGSAEYVIDIQGYYFVPTDPE